MINEILLRRKHKVTVDLETSLTVANPDSLAHLLALELNLSGLGFRLEQNLILSLAKQPTEVIDKLYAELLPAIKKLIGADKEYKVMYPNFPKQVAEISDAELWFNAILHYISYGTWLPEYEKIEREPLEEFVKRQELTLGNLKDLQVIFTNLLSSKTSLSEQDFEDLNWCLENCENSWFWFPDEIPFKETLSWISSKLMEKNKAAILAKYYNTATDVLRLAVSLSEGDVSLAKKTKFKSFSRRERRILFSLLVQCSNLQEDMWRYREQWLRLGERLHPGELKQKEFKKVKDAFKSIREEKKPLFWSGKVEEFIKNGKHTDKEMQTFLELIAQRPGEFARRLDKLLRDYPDYRSLIIKSFSNAADKVSTPVLLQVYSHFRTRNCDDLRIVMPKGSVAKARLLDSFSQDIGNTKELNHVIVKALLTQYSKRSSLGNVWIDPDLNSFVVPFSQRSANGSYKSMTRGSKFTVTKSNVRFFIWWTNTKQNHRVDLDLSAGFYDENWKYIDHVSYTKWRSTGLRCFHSGDITDGKEFGGRGASEFIDVDLNAMSEGGVRYVVMQVHSYSRQPFNQVPCTFGWMERSDLNSGEIYEPTTVENQIGLSSESITSIPLIVDCREKQIIWADFSGSVQTKKANNLEANLIGTTSAAYAAVNIKKVNLFQIATLNTLARGNSVNKVEDADVVFTAHESEIRTVLEEQKKSNDDFKEPRVITQWDLDIFMADFI